MSQSNFAPGNTAPNRRHAWYAAIAVALAMTIAFLLALGLSRSVTGNLFSPPVVVLALPVVGWILAFVLMTRGKFEEGIHLALVIMVLAAPLTSVLVAGRGLILGIGIGVAVLFVATLALPPRRAQWFIVLGVLSGLATVAIDVFGSPARATLNASTLPGILITILLIGFLAAFVLLNFKSYPLRIKLLLAFVTLALVSVGGVTYIATQAIRASLTEHTANDLQTRAQTAAVSVGLTMDRNVDRLITMSLDSRLQNEVATIADSYPADEALRSDLIAQNSARWAGASPQEPVIRNALNGQLAYSLRQLSDVFQGNKELFITDAQGSLIAATDWRPEYNFADTEWWQNAYSHGRGALYVGQPEYDPMLNDYGIPIAVPIYAPGRQRVVGVLHSTFLLTALERALVLNSFEESGRVDLLFPKGEILTSAGEFRKLSEQEFAQVEAGIGQVLPMLNYEGEERVSSQGVVGVSDEQPEPYLRSSAWRTIATIEPAEALALAESGTRAAVLSGIMAVAAAILVALGLAQFLTRPIRRLTNVAEEVQSGNLGARAEVESSDEIGALALSFNNMTARLQDTLTGLEQRVNDRTHELSEANLTLRSNSAYLSALSDTSTGLFERQSLNDLLQATVERAGALMSTQHGFVFFQDPSEDDIVMRVGTGLYDDLIGTHAQRGVGLAGSVWQSGQPMVIEDYQKWEGRLPGSRRDALRAIAAVPLKHGAGRGSSDDETIGVIGLAYTEEGRIFDRSEVEILQRFAQLASIALDNAKLYTNSEERLKELAALNSISQIVAAEKDTKTLAEKVGAQIVQIFASEFAYVALYDANTNTIEFPFVVDGGERSEIPPMPYGQGLTSKVIASGQPILMNTTSEDEYDRAGALDSGDGISPSSLLSVPILAGEHVAGVLSVQHVGGGHLFTGDDERLLSTIAATVGVGIENARLAQATDRRLAELGVLNRVSSVLTTDKPLDERLAQVGRELHSIFGVSSVYVALYDESTDTVTMPFFMGDSEEMQVDSFKLGPGFTSHVIKTRTPLMINTDIEEHIKKFDAFHVGSGDLNESYLGVPIALGEQVFGVVALSDRPKNKFYSSDMELLATIASSIGSAIQNAQLFEQTKERARELDAINLLAREITQQRSLDDLFQQVYVQIKSVTPTDALVVSLYDEAADRFTIPFLLDEGVRYEATPDVTAFEWDHALRVRDGEPLMINNTPEEVAALESNPAVDGSGRVSRSRLYIPLMVGTRFLGMISVHSYEYNAYNPRDVSVLRGLASYIAVALENARLYEQTQLALSETSFQAQRLGILNELSAELNRLQTPEEIYRAAVTQTRDIMRADRAALAIVDEASQSVHWYDIESVVPGANARTFELQDTAIEMSLRERQPLSLVEGELAAYADGAEWIEQGIRACILVPLTGTNNQALGALALGRNMPGQFAAQDEQLLLQIGAILASAIDNRRLFEQTQRALAETQRLAVREREAAEQVMALNRRLTREGWQKYLEVAAGELVYEAAEEEKLAEPSTPPNGNGQGGKKVEVPLVLRGEMIGTIELDYDDPDFEWSSDRQEMVTDVGEKLSLVLDNARLYTESQRRVTELDTLNRISQAATGELDVESLLNVIGDQVREIFDVENVYIALFDKETQMISLPYFVNDNKRIQIEPIRFGEGITSEIIRTREPLLINQDSDEKMARMGAKVYGNRALSFLGVPIFVGEEVTGVLSIQSTAREGMFNEDNLHLLETIAATIGTAIQNAQLYGAMQEEVIVRQRAEDEIKLSLKEKEVLLKEIHHRVKNNLQIITSLLNLQSAQIKDPETVSMFRESQARVRSMALIHEKLYQSKDLARIDFEGYVRDLTIYLFRAYTVNADQILVEIDMPEMFLGIDTAIPCGLIISELITNSMKYAFPNGKRGKIYLGMHPKDDDFLVLEIADNGVGFPDDFDWRESDSLGLQLVSTLTSQLHGKMAVSGQDGARFVLTFPA